MTIDDYKKIIKNRMGEKRFIHSVNVCAEARRLAKKYGADVGKAEVAGILHDINKETEKSVQLQIITEGGIILSDVEKNSDKLWHSISGSIYVNKELGITDEDIINSIRYHTTGRANMNLIEKIIFIADFTSAERNYDGVEIMREKANKSLEDAMLYGLSFSINDLSKRNRLIHPNTISVYNEIILQKEVFA